MSAARFSPVDEAARARARGDHATSLVVEAGAGTGKTTLLVDRIERLVLSGVARLEEVAAVTFTENAAATLKLRLRERLDRARSDPSRPAGERRRAEEALESLERSSISTIHALCASLLQERPLECGLAPGFRTADEAEADLLFAEAWQEWLADALMAGSPVGGAGDGEALSAALEADVPLESEGPWGERASLRGLARALVEQRDLEPLLADLAVDPAAWRAELEAKARQAREVLAEVEDGDPLATRLTTLVAFAEQARFLSGPALETHLAALAAVPRNLGQRQRWTSAEALERARDLAAWTGQARQAWTAARGAALHARLVRALVGVGERYARLKASRGALDFLDLLLRARDALRDRPALRAHFRRRHRHLIIDEFQDTDPLQVEVAELLTGGEPGRLCVVGDAKQSIYRFRRAEVSLFRRLADEAREKPGRAVLQLTQSFRSRPGILRFVNRAFSTLLVPSEEAGQPAYEPIAPPPHLDDGPAVLALSFEAREMEGEDLLHREAAALAAFLAPVARGAHEVRDPGDGRARPSRAGDVMVLSRRLTQVRHLEEALEAAALRFTVEGGKSFFDRQEVHEALAVLRAVDDPSDRVSLVAALRSSFFGVSDRDVVLYALSSGRLGLGEVDEAKPGAAALGPALALLAELHHDRARLTPAAVLERLLERTRVVAALTGTRRGEAQVANLEKVAALARQSADLGALTLRGFVRLLQERLETSREEPDLPSTRPGDPATVRILSIHKAKGLEAPVVALYDTADEGRASVDVVPLWREGRVAVGFRRGCQPPGWDALVKADQARGQAEARRLLYVACTRARDWLVLPSPSGGARLGAFWSELIGLLPSQAPAASGESVAAPTDPDVRVVDADALPELATEAPRLDLRSLAAATGGDPVAARWDAERRALLEAASARPLAPVSVTRIAARTAPPPVVTAAGEGRSFGSLVHRALEWAPLDGPERGAAIARALAPAFGLDEEAAHRAAAEVSRTLALPVVARALAAPRHWRELPVVFPEDSDLAEGVVDLVFEEDGALVVVDYKTDHVSPEQALAQAAHHAPQLQLYGRGLAQATGLAVRERLVVFTALGQEVRV